MEKNTIEQQLRNALKSVEWSGYTQGQGSGYMSSGGDGPMVRCCPSCRGIDPTDPHRGDFIDSAHGHRVTCKLSAAPTLSESGAER